MTSVVRQRVLISVVPGSKAVHDAWSFIKTHENGYRSLFDLDVRFDQPLQILKESVERLNPATVILVTDVRDRGLTLGVDALMRQTTSRADIGYAPVACDHLFAELKAVGEDLQRLYVVHSSKVGDSLRLQAAELTVGTPLNRVGEIARITDLNLLDMDSNSGELMERKQQHERDSARAWSHERTSLMDKAEDVPAKKSEICLVNPKDSFSIVTWVKPGRRSKEVWADTRWKDAGEGGWPRGKDARGWSMMALQYRTDAPALTLQLNTGTDGTPGGHGWSGHNYVARGARRFEPDQWYSCVAVVDHDGPAVNVRLYVNEHLDKPQAQASPAVQHQISRVDFFKDRPLLLGDSRDAWSGPVEGKDWGEPRDFSGEVAGVAVYPWALTESQIASLANELRARVVEWTALDETAERTVDMPLFAEPPDDREAITAPTDAFSYDSVHRFRDKSAWGGRSERHKVHASAQIQLSNPVAISHEGHENHKSATLDGFLAARELGIRFMETDIRLLANGELVALHEALGDVEDDDVHSDVPTIRALLTREELADVNWNFEFKGDDGTAAEKFAQLLGDLEPFDRNRLLVSFGTAWSTQAVERIRAALPGVAFAASLRERANHWDLVPQILASQPDFEAEDVLVAQMLHEPMSKLNRLLMTREDVAQAHEAGLAIHAYKILGALGGGKSLAGRLFDQVHNRLGLRNELEDLWYLCEIGVDGVMIDRHDALSRWIAGDELLIVVSETDDELVADAFALALRAGRLCFEQVDTSTSGNYSLVLEDGQFVLRRRDSGDAHVATRTVYR